MPRKEKSKKYGNGLLKSEFVGVRLDPVEYDFVLFIAKELSEQNGKVSISDAIRYLIRKEINEVISKYGLTIDDIRRQMYKELKSRENV